MKIIRTYKHKENKKWKYEQQKFLPWCHYSREDKEQSEFWSFIPQLTTKHHTTLKALYL